MSLPKIRGARPMLKRIAAAAVLIALFVAFPAWLWLGRPASLRREALAQARKIADGGNPELALRHLDQYLRQQPDDPEPLDFRAKLLAEQARTPAQTIEVARLHDRLVRLDPDGPGRQQTRRRLADLYLRYADSVRASSLSKSAPTLAVRESQYHAAEQVARDLIRRGADDAEAHRLLGRALEGLAVPGDDSALRGAIDEYERALSKDPADADAAGRLADLYFGRAANPARGDRVLDGMLAARPGAASRLARQRVYDRLGRRDRAAEELTAAVAEAPTDLDVRLAATSEALRRGDLAEARRHLDAVPAAADDPRVRIARGLIDFGDARPDEAIAGWRRGLVAAGGVNPELTWWLAYALIQLGRADDARALVDHYHRLEGDDGEPLYLLLRGLMAERAGRPARAIRDLERALGRVDGPWAETARLALGRCFEDLNDDARALDAYRRAAQADLGASPPRLAIAGLLLKRGKAGEAAAELQRGLESSPREPRLLLTLARARIREQAALDPKARNFAEVDRVLARAREAAGPQERAELAALLAERTSASGDLAGSVEVLAAAAAADPRSASAWSNWAEALARQGHVAEALAALDKGVDPGAAGDRAVLRISRAALLMGMGRGREARRVLVDRVEALPAGDRPRVWELAARFAESKGDVASARAAYLAWSGQFRDDPRPRLGLLGLALDSGDVAAALRAIEALRDPADPGDVAWRLGRALERLIAAEAPGKSADQAEALREGVELTEAVLADAPEVAAGSFLRGWACRLRGRTDEAVDAYRRAWERGVDAALPPLVELLASRGRVDDLAALRHRRPGAAAEADRLAAGALVRIGRIESAGRFLDRLADDARGDSAESDLWLARMLDRAGKVDRAEGVLLGLAGRRPSEPEPWLVLLRYQVDHGRKERAEATRSLIRSQAATGRPWIVEARILWTSGETAAAGRAFDVAVSAHPEDVPTRLAAAGFYEGTGRSADAEDSLRAALAREPGNRPAARQLATLLSDRARDDPAVWGRAYASLGPEPDPKRAPEPAADVMARAYVLSRAPDRARRAEAIARLENLVADLPPTDLAVGQSARRVLAKLLMEADRHDRAAQVAAVSAAGGDDPADVALFAEATLRAGNLAEAARQLDLLAMLAPGDPKESELRIRLIRASTPPQGVAEALEKAVADRKGAPSAAALAREAVEQLAALGETAAEGRVAGQLAAVDPGSAWMLARSLAREGKVAEALDECRKAVAVAGPKDAHRSALVALQAARKPKAPKDAKAGSEAILDEALRRHPDSVPLIDLAIVLRHEQAAFEDEVRLCRRALALEPENALALNNLACALCEGLKQPAQALAPAEALVRARGKIPATLGTRGLVLTRLGRLEEAIRDLEQATRDLAEPGIGSSQGTTADAASLLRLAYLARAYLQAGRDADFRRCRDQARRLGLDPRQLDATERDEIERLMGL